MHELAPALVPVFVIEPALQSVHEVSVDAVEYLPAAQGVHVVAPAAAAVWRSRRRGSRRLQASLLLPRCRYQRRGLTLMVVPIVRLVAVRMMMQLVRVMILIMTGILARLQVSVVAIIKMTMRGCRITMIGNMITQYGETFM